MEWSERKEKPSMEADAYLKHPCGMSSLPYWKTKTVVIPDRMLILRDDAFRQRQISGHDTVYFRMQHDLKSLPSCCLASSFERTHCSMKDFADHINECYDHEHISEEELSDYADHPVFDPSLWIAVREKKTHRIVATGIAELDTDISEGILEWIQVSPAFRRQGLGKYVVCELLCRMQERAAFATVSGRMENESNPYALYRSCGFSQPVIWHIITQDDAGPTADLKGNRNP